jgi:hypothetical protein
MRGIGWLCLAGAAAWLLVACAGNPRPGDPGYRYNVTGTYGASFVVEGTPYTGTMTLATAPGGAVSGTMSLTSPVPLESPAAGSLVADSLRLAIPYMMPDGCNGTATLRGQVADGGGAAEGAMEVEDSCGGTLAGTFTLTR